MPLFVSLELAIYQLSKNNSPKHLTTVLTSVIIKIKNQERELEKMEMAERIKGLRQRLGMSQDAFAAKLGVTPMTIRRWESGRTKPSPMATKLIKLVEEQS